MQVFCEPLHAQKALDYLFHFNGQEAWTEYTRVTTLHVAKRTLNRWAEDAQKGDKKAQKYLSELNVTVAQVVRWDGESLSLAEQAEYEQLKADGIRGDRFNELHKNMKNRRAVQDALVRFTEESVVRPNAAHRPAGASDPRYMLLWHLKSFFYSYGKIIVLPFLNHMREQIANTQLPANATMATKIKLYGKEVAIQSLPLLMAAVMLGGLAALGWEAREAIQYRLFGAEPRTDGMDMGEYLMELSSRAGIYGPYELAMNMIGGYGGMDERSAMLLGPTADWMHTMVTADSVAARVYRSTPVLNQLPGLKQLLNESME